MSCRVRREGLFFMFCAMWSTPLQWGAHRGSFIRTTTTPWVCISPALWTLGLMICISRCEMLLAISLPSEVWSAIAFQPRLISVFASLLSALIWLRLKPYCPNQLLRGLMDAGIWQLMLSRDALSSLIRLVIEIKKTPICLRDFDPVLLSPTHFACF